MHEAGDEPDGSGLAGAEDICRFLSAKVQRISGVNGTRENRESRLIRVVPPTAQTVRSLFQWGSGGFLFSTKYFTKRRISMAKDKKLVEAITSMDVDFAQWYTDVVKRQN